MPMWELIYNRLSSTDRHGLLHHGVQRLEFPWVYDCLTETQMAMIPSLVRGKVLFRTTSEAVHQYTAMTAAPV